MWPCSWEDILFWNSQWGASLVPKAQLHAKQSIIQKDWVREATKASLSVPCTSQKLKGRLSGWGGNAITSLTMLIYIPFVVITGQLLGKRAFNLNVKQKVLLTALASVHWWETCHLLYFSLPGNECMCSALKLISTPLFSLSPQIDKKSVILTENEHSADIMICGR